MSEMILIRGNDAVALARLKVEDANSPNCYRVRCSCHANLGILAQFMEKDGIRSVRCGRCDLVTLIAGARILAVVPYATLPQKPTPHDPVQ